MPALVVNEWLWEDLRGATTEQRQRESLAFLAVLAQATDRILVVRASRFLEKFWRLCKSEDLVQREAARVFKSLLFDDSRCRILDPAELPPAIPEVAGQCNEDDLYLVRSQQAEAGSIVITTDQPLIELLRRHGLHCEHRDEWLPRYVETQ